MRACSHGIQELQVLTSQQILLYRPGAGCSKLTTSFVNVSLKSKMLILQIHCY